MGGGMEGGRERGRCCWRDPGREKVFAFSAGREKKKKKDSLSGCCLCHFFLEENLNLFIASKLAFFLEVVIFLFR